MIKEKEIKSVLTQLIKINEMKEAEAKSKRQNRRKAHYFGRISAIRDIAEILKIKII